MTKENFKVFFNNKEETYTINKKEDNAKLIYEGRLTNEQKFIIESNISINNVGMYK